MAGEGVHVGQFSRAFKDGLGVWTPNSTLRAGRDLWLSSCKIRATGACRDLSHSHEKQKCTDRSILGYPPSSALLTGLLHSRRVRFLGLQFSLLRMEDDDSPSNINTRFDSVIFIKFLLIAYYRPRDRLHAYTQCLFTVY